MKETKIDLKIDNNEKDMLIQILQVPVMAFGYNVLLKKIKVSKEQIEYILKKVKDNDLLFSSEEFELLKKFFRAAIDIADPQEINSLTGYTWEQANELFLTLKKKKQ